MLFWGGWNEGQMSKLLKLKKFFTLEEAAIYLTNVLEEPVSIATLYQLIADKQVMLSVRLINQAYALKGQIFECEEGDLIEFKTDLVTGEVLEKPQFEYVTDDNSIPVSAERLFIYDQKAHIVDGTWDLAMLGEESLRVEHLYQNEVNSGYHPLLTDAWGFYLKQGEVYCRLIRKSQDKVSEVEGYVFDCLDFLVEQRGLTADEFWDLFEKSEIALSEDEMQTLESCCELMNLPDDSLKFFEDSRSLEENDAQLVIKTSEITKLIQSLDAGSDIEPQKDKSLTQERTTFLILLYTLLKEQKIDPYRRGVTSSVRLMTENAGYRLADNTILKVLSQMRDEPFGSSCDDKDFSTRERQTLIKLLYALLKEQGTNPSSNNLPSLMINKASAIGYTISEDIVIEIIEQLIDFIA